MAQQHSGTDHHHHAHEHGGLDDLHADLDTTPTFEAAREGDVDALAAILDADVTQLHARDKYKLTPLHWACDRGQPRAAALLLERGADVDAVEKRLFKRTPLLFAALSGNEELVKLLLTHQANVAAADYKGWSAVHCAAHVGSVEILRALVAAGASVSALTKRKESVLHVAARAGREELLARLVAGVQAAQAPGTAAADPEKHLVHVDDELLGARDEDGNAAVDTARAAGHDRIVGLLATAQSAREVF
ncbi:hypothetical protein Gpo141_00008017 [Globisporangium polare]